MFATKEFKTFKSTEPNGGVIRKPKPNLKIRIVDAEDYKQNKALTPKHSPNSALGQCKALNAQNQVMIDIHLNNSLLSTECETIAIPSFNFGQSRGDTPLDTDGKEETMVKYVGTLDYDASTQ